MTHRKFTLTVAECEGGWQVLVDGDADVFRTVETREQAEAMAAKWHELLYPAPKPSESQVKS